MIPFLGSKEKSKEAGKCLNPQLWHACAGGMVQMPPVNSKVFYFPQGHAEHACASVDFRNYPRIPAYIPCRVSAMKFMADPESDEVYAKITLVPLNVPRYCAETIFPRLDYTADPPVQNILAKDVHGETWKFRHIYRGTPRRHLLTTGWSTFVNHKKLIAGDSIVFLRAENGDLCVGIRRAKRGIGCGPESSSGWNPAGCNYVMPYGGFSAFLREDENKLTRNGNGGSSGSNGSFFGRVKVTAEAVIEAVRLAVNGQPFEVIYYPRASTPEFCVKSSLVKSASQIRWCSGMRFKMAFETEDSSRISWFMGTISSVQVADPVRWPDSPWRLLQVTWDEPDLLQNVKRVSPWLVELVSNMPSIHLTHFSPPRKKLRFPQYPDFPLDAQFSMPTFSSNLVGPSNPFGCLSDNIPAGMQGARHAQYGLSLSDPHHNKFQSETSKKSDDRKTGFTLFGRSILTEQQMSQSCSGDTVSPVITGNSSSEGNQDKMANFSDGSGSALHQHGLPEHSSCEGYQTYKVNHREPSPTWRLVTVRDATGAVKHIGDEPFSDFTKTAKRLTILMDSSSDNVGVYRNKKPQLSNVQLDDQILCSMLTFLSFLGLGRWGARLMQFWTFQYKASQILVFSTTEEAIFEFWNFP
ncbi:Auxin response factor 18 [Vitis vinifera]|uniref:Auxin response factor n=1 Tax=Vitis vinifera TaxID=29760 RepID=A0A438H7B5_VITVI|nr:Auxin response factor 18 [Vitis vinifera]